MSKEQTFIEWRFDNTDALKVWRASNEVADVRFESGAMHFRTAGSDPIWEYLPLLDLPTAPHQAVEIELMSSGSGVAELFWSNTTQSPYGGFLPEKRTDFSVQGDGKWHIYRVFPFWQREGRIIRLRFDPPAMSECALRAIRIVQLPDMSASSGKRSFSFRNTLTGWQSWRGVVAQPSAQGVRLRLQEHDGFFASMVRVPAEEFPIVSIRLRSTRAKRCHLVFATANAYGIQQHAFEVIPDGKPYQYNIDMLDAPGWNGEIVMLGVRPGEQVGDEMTLEEVQVTAQPQGKPRLRVLFFGVEDALPRTDSVVTVTLRVLNVGGEPVKGLAAGLRLPPTARTVRKPQTPITTLPFGAEAEWRWQVMFSQAGKEVLTAQVQGINWGPVRASVSAEVTPRLVQVKSTIVASPAPVRPKYPVGVYYFPGWRTAGQWSPITRFPERKPVLGWYREGDPQIADWHIKWAVEHGITFFAYDWYWVQGARQLEHALHEGYFRSRYHRYLQFCLLWANHNPPNTSSHEDCIAVTRHWIEHYFHRPEHLRIDGKPVVIIFSPYRLRADIGSDGVKRAFDAMREECARAGLGGLYLIACVGGAGDARVAAREGYDAVTAYNWPHLGIVGDTKWAPYDTLIEGYRQQWESIVQNSSIPLLPPVCGGWDSRPWHGQSALVRYGRTPEKFKRHLQDALRFVETYPRSVVPMVLIEAWNEWGEGSYIEPHGEFGFGYLDAIREVFTSAPKRHTDLTPADIGLPAPQVELFSVTVPRWEFKRNTLGWDNGMYIEESRIESGALTTRTTGNDPAFFGPPVQVNTSQYRRIRLRMRLEAEEGVFEDMGQMFWATRSVAESEATSMRFPVFVDGKWHEYVLKVDENPRWRGVVTRLRLDPCTHAGVTVQIALIELLP
ncbi:MAG: glycoside hydrolase family 99-like domain-containing protein [Armatimonadota bacterium]